MKSKEKENKTKCCVNQSHPSPQTLKILNRKLVFCFLVKIQKRLDTILRWVQYYVARTSLSEGPLRPVPEALQMNHLLSRVTSQMQPPVAQEATHRHAYNSRAVQTLCHVA